MITAILSLFAITLNEKVIKAMAKCYFHFCSRFIAGSSKAKSLHEYTFVRHTLSQCLIHWRLLAQSSFCSLQSQKEVQCPKRGLSCGLSRIATIMIICMAIAVHVLYSTRVRNNLYKKNHDSTRWDLQPLTNDNGLNLCIETAHFSPSSSTRSITSFALRCCCQGSLKAFTRF